MNAGFEKPAFSDVQSFMVAAYDGDKAGIDAFLDRFGPKAIEVTRGEQLGWTALMWAAQSGNTDSLALLLDRGADIHRRDSAGDTPLFIAARQGWPEAVRLLLARGAGADETDAHNRTPAEVARAAGRKAAATVLEEAEERQRAIAEAARSFQDKMRKTAASGRFRLKPP